MGVASGDWLVGVAVGVVSGDFWVGVVKDSWPVFVSMTSPLVAGALL